MPRKLEVCIDSIESAINAFEACVDRIELCSALFSEGGLTPSVGLLKVVQELNVNKIPIYCMLRCRGGDFCYNDLEIKAMKEDALILKQNGADGFVFGALTKDNTIDMKRSREILITVYPAPLTFHRAFDVCTKPFLSLEILIDLGYKRVLTSGQAPTALKGIEMLKKLLERAQDKIIIMPGSGINVENVTTLLSEIPQIKEVHTSASIVKTNQNISVQSENEKQNGNDKNGKEITKQDQIEFGIYKNDRCTDSEVVKKMIVMLNTN